MSACGTQQSVLAQHAAGLVSPGHKEGAQQQLQSRLIIFNVCVCLGPPAALSGSSRPAQIEHQNFLTQRDILHVEIICHLR